MTTKENSDGYTRRVIVTGGAGFIGSHLVRLLVNNHPDWKIINLDKLTYAGNLENLKDVEHKPNYMFVKMDILDLDGVEKLMREERVDGVIHLAAESHVDRSISDPFVFARTNVIGTLSLLEASRRAWESTPEGFGGKMFHHVSTDEVFGALELDRPEGVEAPFSHDGKPHTAFGSLFFSETRGYDPHSPYSASKASSDHFVRAYRDTYGMPTIITNCSNNYGPYQFPEKLIPLFVNNIVLGKPLPVYGKGENVRDWLYVEDHARALECCFMKASPGDTYCIGGFNEMKNIDLIMLLISITDKLLGRPAGTSLGLISHVTDRKGHDLRYAIDSRKITEELGWRPSLKLEEGMRKTVEWYLANRTWTERVTSGEYADYYRKMYEGR